MRARRESEEEHTRLGVAESRHRLGPVFPIAIGALLLLSDLLAVRDQPRTARASDDILIELGEPGGHRLILSLSRLLNLRESSEDAVVGIPAPLNSIAL